MKKRFLKHFYTFDDKIYVVPLANWIPMPDRTPSMPASLPPSNVYT